MRNSFLAIFTAGCTWASLAAPAANTAATGAPATRYTDPPPPPATMLFRTQMATIPRTNFTARAGTDTEILSQRASFDLKERTVLYSGNVRVRDPRMDLTCELLTIKLGGAGGQFENVIAEKNVAIDFIDEKKQRIHATGGRAVYTYKVTAGVTNDLIELFDEPVLETPQGKWAGDVIRLDRANSQIRVTNSRLVIRPDPADPKAPSLVPKIIGN